MIEVEQARGKLATLAATHRVQQRRSQVPAPTVIQ